MPASSAFTGSCTDGLSSAEPTGVPCVAEDKQMSSVAGAMATPNTSPTPPACRCSTGAAATNKSATAKRPSV